MTFKRLRTVRARRAWRGDWGRGVCLEALGDRVRLCGAGRLADVAPEEDATDDQGEEAGEEHHQGKRVALAGGAGGVAEVLDCEGLALGRREVVFERRRALPAVAGVVAV